MFEGYIKDWHPLVVSVLLDELEKITTSEVRDLSYFRTHGETVYHLTRRKEPRYKDWFRQLDAAEKHLFTDSFKDFVYKEYQAHTIYAKFSFEEFAQLVQIFYMSAPTRQLDRIRLRKDICYTDIGLLSIKPVTIALQQVYAKLCKRFDEIHQPSTCIHKSYYDTEDKPKMSVVLDASGSIEETENHLTNNKDEHKSINTSEIRRQVEKITVGIRRRGKQICGKGGATATSVGYISNREISV